MAKTKPTRLTQGQRTEKLVNRKAKQSESAWKQKGEGCPKVLLSLGEK